MQNARMLGNYVSYLATQQHKTVSDLSAILGCNDAQTNSFLKGRSFASFEQISKLAVALCASVADLIAGNEAIYDATVVDCMNKFDNSENREIILDIMDEYLDIINAVCH